MGLVFVSLFKLCANVSSISHIDMFMNVFKRKKMRMLLLHALPVHIDQLWNLVQG